MQLDLFREIIVDNFAGGGGASTGIEMATGLNVDIAINHDPAAIAMHKANHPDTEHYLESVWDVDPREVVKGRKVGLCWFSPDCTHFSKAKGGKPKKKEIRGLAWVAVRWAATVRPRVIILENVEEFKTWGPLLENGHPDPNKKGKTFKAFVNALKRQGYQVKFKELRACDYGAPTTRKRFFMIARCDGKPIIWPKATHGEPDEVNVQLGLKKPYRTAGEIIDWSIPVPSIFGRKKPLAENTMIRIGRGIGKFVLEDEPFVVDDAAYFLIHYYTHQGDEVRGSSLREPISTIPTANRFGLVKATLTENITLNNETEKVYAFLTKFYGSDIGQSLNGPLHTITTKDRFGLVTVKGSYKGISDIGLRMLQPRELFNAQGFPTDYIIDKDFEGKSYPKTSQVARVGNSVPPPFAKSLVKANLPELCRKELKIAR
ncbi:DNA cytosine methyltransferase [Lederbergia wuyishanensis]|uniref:DNA (cytosine-5-)-methyltransferase n=1 Tax=Lederbergia wuyishanensis TaxID=1347903 RepID=A0ABU0D7A4_9BACI|nr:DNA cytosine methyltransferase [Lederbergia wuyishanensis]MCJ8008924.1 DNA cytosine methyltransferase [Lederbergia wuyishanensis]MDQ0344250.1 DNA (cytosine-5)-methyltransferase 1 [Lederbergia wuyishanensis]